MRSTKKGFTLVELLVVIAILAILATVSVVGYTAFIEKAHQSVAMQEMTQIRNALVAEDITNNYFNLEDGISGEGIETVYAAEGDPVGGQSEAFYVLEFVKELGIAGTFEVSEGKLLFSPAGKDATATCDFVTGEISTAKGALEDDDQSTEPVEPQPCEHEGGEATCTQQAICTKCEQPYGDLAQHIASADDNNCATEVKCQNCDYVFVEAKANHTLGENGQCAVAGCEVACQATITFDDTSKRTTLTTEQQVWVENGITVTNNKASSTSDIDGQYFKPARFYKSSELIVAYNSMIRIEFHCNTEGYASALANSNIENATAVQNGKTVIVTFAEATDSFTIEKLSAQVRVDSIKVHIDYTCEHQNTTEIPAVPATCTKTGLTTGRMCNDCSAIIVAQTETPVVDHTEETVPGKEATCTETGLTEGKKCSVCDKTLVEQEEISAKGHNYVEGTCTTCGDKQLQYGDEKTVTVKISDYATANSWTNQTQYNTINIDNNVTATATGGGNTGKYYDSGTNWRMYQTENAQITISAKGVITSVKITYTIEKTGVLTLNGTNVASGTTVEVNAESITFGVGNTGSETNGQVRITEIEVVYKPIVCAEHTWEDADCDTPKTCSTCGATEGEALGHSWTDATCTTPKTCNTCGTTEGTAGEHNYVEGTCSVCGAVEPVVGEPTTVEIAIAGSTGVLSGDSISWTDNGVTVTNTKGSTAIRTSDTDHYRVYAGSKLKISATDGNITKIAITCTSSSYANVVATSVTNPDYTVSVSGNVVTITVDSTDPVESVDITISSQTRINKVEVTYTPAN